MKTTKKSHELFQVGTGVDRRSFALGTAGAATVFLRSGKAVAQGDGGDKFILYIHAGSWCGLSSGLVQPPTAAWPSGVFKDGSSPAGVTNASTNPIMNRLYKHGNMVLHPYSFPLMEIPANDICVATGNARTVDHGAAVVYQATGGSTGSSNPAWVVGLAQALAGTNGRGLVVGPIGFSTKDSFVTPSVGLITAKSMTNFNDNFTDVAALTSSPSAQRFWDVLKTLNTRRDLVAAFAPDNVRGSLNGYLDNLSSGRQPIDAAEINAINTAISAATVNALIDRRLTAGNDAAGVKALQPLGLEENFDRSALLEQIRLAAGLIKSKAANGMSIVLPSQDLHFGGAAVYTARAAALLHAHVALLWKWVTEEGLKDQVMIVISHDFTRTPYRTSRGAVMHNVQYKAKPNDPASPLVTQKIPCWGTDHHPIMGMILINGKMNAPGGLRIGALGDGYTVRGTDAATGAPKNIAAFNSLEIVGSVLRRCWGKDGDLFADERTLTDLWKGYKEIGYVVG